MSDSLLPNDNALLFFREVVEPTVAEFLAERASKRRGCLACLALASMTEHYVHARVGGVEAEKALKTFKPAARDENKAVGWIADVANATRHVIRSDKFDAIGFGDIQATEMGQSGILRCGWPIAGEEVLVGPDHEWCLSELIKCAMDFWRQKLGLNAEAAARSGDPEPVLSL